MIQKILERSISIKTSDVEIADTIRVGDYDAYELRIKFFDITAIPGDVRLRFQRPDGLVIVTEPVTVSGNTVIHPMTTDEILAGGPLIAWVQMSDNNLYTPLKITFTGVADTPHDEGIADSTEYPELLRVIGEANTATTSANTAAQSANDAATSCAGTEQATKDAEALRVTAETARAEQASTDHQTAVSDHTLAGTDHTTAQSDHTTAGTDHTTAQSDHTTASTDHTNALTDRAAITPTINEVQAARGGFANLDARLNNDEAYNITPVASLTINSNKSVAVTAIDLATGTFTSAGHSLVNGDNVYPVLNLDAGAVYLIDKIPGGLVAPAPLQKYFVINKTSNTFQLSLTSGGAAVTFTNNANMDLTKWHFEVPANILMISGLPSLSKFRVEVSGRSIVSNQGVYITPYGMGNVIDQTYVKNGVSVYFYPTFSYSGDVYTRVTALIDFSDYLTIRMIINKANSATANTNTMVLSDTTARSVVWRNFAFTQIQFNLAFFANGTKIEVYKL